MIFFIYYLLAVVKNFPFLVKLLIDSALDICRVANTGVLHPAFSIDTYWFNNYMFWGTEIIIPKTEKMIFSTASFSLYWK